MTVEKHLIPFKVVYTISDKGSMVEELVNSLRTIRRFIEKEDIIVFYTPPRSKNNLKRLSKLATVLETENLTKPFIFSKDRDPSRYGEKIHLCDVECPNVIFLDADTIIRKDITKLLEGDYVFYARPGDANPNFDKSIWGEMFKKVGREPILMPNTGFMIFKNYSHREIKEEWLKYINDPNLPNPHPSSNLKEQYALSLVISGRKIKWMTRNEHAFLWQNEYASDIYVLHGRFGQKSKKIDLIKFIKDKTRGVRHKIVKIIAPKLYETAISKQTQIRPMIRFVKNNLGPNLVGAEIGVASGNNVLSMLNNLSLKRLYLIDPYMVYSESRDNNRKIIDPTRYFQIAEKNLIKYKNKIRWILLPSDKAHNHIKEKLDFIYIDGCHDYPFIKKDIELYYPKVKPRGIIGGHDYSIHFPDVVKAVNEFIEKTNHKLQTEYLDWWVVKKD